jgi:hypothetical protein
MLTLLEAMKTWLEPELGRVSAKSKLVSAIRHALRHWQGLSLFPEDGRVEVACDTIERTIRPIKLSRKNHLFARLRWRCRKLGNDRLADPDRQTQ